MFCSVTPWISTGLSRCVSVCCTARPNQAISCCSKFHLIDKPSSLRGVVKMLSSLSLSDLLFIDEVITNIQVYQGFIYASFLYLQNFSLFLEIVQLPVILWTMPIQTLRFYLLLLFPYLDTMLLMTRLSGRSWERNSPKEQRKIWTTSVPKQV